MSHRSLSVLHFSTADISGGSARSAYRIHSGLRERGHRSRMLVGYRQSDDPDVQSVADGKLLHLADRCANRVGEYLGHQYTFVPSSFRTARHSWVREADVIQLFNTHGGYFALGLLPQLARQAPIVWRLSDLWPLTGHCAYPGDCSGWLHGCGNCPDLATYPPIRRDRTASLYRRKQRIYSKLQLTVVAPSSWAEQQVRQSPLLNRFPIHRIPNGLYGAQYRPLPREEARKRLAVPANARVLLFSAHILDANPRKGGEILLQALNMLGPQEGWTLALMGEGGGSWLGQAPIPICNFGFQSDPAIIAQCYAAADVVVIPSVHENLPNTLIESLACGRTVVASDCGGMRDGVIDGTTGLLVKKGDARELAAGLKQILTADARRSMMEREARELFDREFSAQRELDRLEALYTSLVMQSSALRAAHRGTTFLRSDK